MEHSILKAIFAKYANEKGWISLTPEAIASMETDDSIERIDLTKSLIGFFNFSEKEFNPESDIEYRFINENC